MDTHYHVADLLIYHNVQLESASRDVRNLDHFLRAVIFWQSRDHRMFSSRSRCSNLQQIKDSFSRAEHFLTEWLIIASYFDDKLFEKSRDFFLFVNLSYAKILDTEH